MTAPETAGSARPAPLDALPLRLCRDLSILFSDIDDTLTTNGMLPESSYGALWDLARAGIRIVPVTGRPAGWCDHIARMWPVAGVVGENGAFYYAYDRERRVMTRRHIDVEPVSLSSGRDKLSRIAARVLREVPGTALAADQAFRVSDFAIDYCEDVQPLPPESVDAICRILSEEGVHFKVSSIHVNFWLGNFDKLSGVRLFLSGQAIGTLEDLAEQAVFIGDSPNDEPLFQGFPHSIAVGNLRRFLPRLVHMPEFLTERDSGEGFREAADAILKRRARPQ